MFAVDVSQFSTQEQFSWLQPKATIDKRGLKCMLMCNPRKYIALLSKLTQPTEN